MPTPKQYASAAERQAAYRQRQAQARTTEREAKGLPASPPIPTMPSRERWNALQEQARVNLQTMVDEMQVYHDDRSQQWQESEKGEEFQERINVLESILTDLEGIT